MHVFNLGPEWINGGALKTFSSIGPQDYQVYATRKFLVHKAWKRFTHSLYMGFTRIFSRQHDKQRKKAL
jgi:hypothetical protein